MSRWRKITIREDQFKTLAEYEQLTGISVATSVNEALQDHIECCVSVELEELAGKAGSA